MSPRTNESAPEGERRDEDTGAHALAGGGSEREAAPTGLARAAADGPDLTVGPGVTNGSDDTDGPGVTDGPDDTDGPGVTDGPDDTDGPGVTDGRDAAGDRDAAEAERGAVGHHDPAAAGTGAAVAKASGDNGHHYLAEAEPGATEAQAKTDGTGTTDTGRAQHETGPRLVAAQAQHSATGHHDPVEAGTGATQPDGTATGETDTARAEQDTTAEPAGQAVHEITGPPAGQAAHRIAARPVGEPRRGRVLRLAACAAALAVAITSGAIALGHREEQPVSTSNSSGITAQLLAGGDLDANVATLQSHLRAQPKDYLSWATLGLAYVEQARTKGDPARYPQAEKALKRSLDLRPDNDPALAGQAALAAARHDFKHALRYADQALEQNPYSERALSTRIDALVELGRYDDASKAADLADDRRPGIPVFTRYAYVHELRGDTKTAERVLKLALNSAMGRGDIAYVATQLGQLAWKQGDYKGALNHFARALAADDEYLPALEGRARAEAASGDRDGAIRTLEKVVATYPLPGPLVELGELYEVKGDKTKARDQYTLVNAWTSIARANGVNADLDTALADADHGDREEALRAARAEFKLRQTVHTADALAWALHVNGRSDEALPYARRAAATGYKDATFLYHRGMIEQATGNDDEARRSLDAALDLNSGFSPLGAEKARKALKVLEAAK
ncbi:tetratricopeptide repeat protein [Streptomyces spongiae]|uniref:Tetratricopeptide repeat protein n=1 Tax=Streptomyces spongiae TaxID=565072 RepID=A0A5N8XSM8_9ACTN|nr:tetratricopeptide repeat protein [Streptomyces spongiae]MPY62411.1 tetratricopeptide repeat protein [Streptomyces spongiae]